MEKWGLQGELILNCNCTVFCPCVISLGQHRPTEGFCQTWAGISIKKGFYDNVDLSGLCAGLLIDIPSYMTRGGWSLGIYIDSKASDKAFEALEKILKGKAKGTSGLVDILTANYLGAQRADMTYEKKGESIIFQIPKIIDGEVVPIAGKEDGKPVIIKNSSYWVSEDIIVGKAKKGKVRAFGRLWDFKGRSAEICELNWSGPEIP